MDEYKVGIHCRNNLFRCARRKRYIRSKRKAVAVIICGSELKFRKRCSNRNTNACNIGRCGLGNNSIPHSFVIAIRYGNELERNLCVRHHTYGSLDFNSAFNIETVYNRKSYVIDACMIYEILLTVYDAIIVPIGILEINRVRNRNCFCRDYGHCRKAVRIITERRQVAPGVVRSTIACIYASIFSIFYIPCSNIVFRLFSKTGNFNCGSGRHIGNIGDRRGEVFSIVDCHRHAFCKRHAKRMNYINCNLALASCCLVNRECRLL